MASQGSKVISSRYLFSVYPGTAACAPKSSRALHLRPPEEPLSALLTPRQEGIWRLCSRVSRRYLAFLHVAGSHPGEGAQGGSPTTMPAPGAAKVQGKFGGWGIWTPPLHANNLSEKDFLAETHCDRPTRPKEVGGYMRGAHEGVQKDESLAAVWNSASPPAGCIGGTQPWLVPPISHAVGPVTLILNA